MTSTPSGGPVIPVKPQPTVYTVLLLVAIVALVVTLAVVLYTLMSPTPQGYGLEFGDLFGPLKQPGPPAR
ncbi:MAG TPA: hypothetical protein VNA25_08710 [Phycisphaerae bacterium]|nr:hypothetical protein [Phycisphaerae bacterium]